MHVSLACAKVPGVGGMETSEEGSPGGRPRVQLTLEERVKALEEDVSLIFEEWLEEFPCTCELCVARRQNRRVDTDKVMSEIKDILLSEDIDVTEIFKDDSTTESGSD